MSYTGHGAITALERVPDSLSRRFKRFFETTEVSPEVVTPTSQPFNLAQYISDHPYQTSLGALGLGGLTYAALGGNEGVSRKIQAMIDNPLATASGLGAAGVLSKITYDALNKEASAPRIDSSKDNSKLNAILGGALGGVAGTALGGMRGGSPARMLGGLLAGGALGGGLGYFTGKPEEAPPQLFEDNPYAGGMSHPDFPNSSVPPTYPDAPMPLMSMPGDAPLMSIMPEDAPSTPKETGRLGALAGGLGGGLLGAAVPAVLMRGSGRGATAALAGLATAGIGSALGSTYKSSFDPFSFGRGVSDKLKAIEKSDTAKVKALAKKVIANPLAAPQAILGSGGALEQRSKQENNALAAADNFIDNYGNYLLGGAALAGTGYGGYKLYQHLKDKPRAKTASFGEDYYNVQKRPGDVGIPQILGASTLYGGTLGALTGAGVGAGAGLIAGLTHPRGQKLLAMTENAARFGVPAALSVGAMATLGLGGAMLLKKMRGNKENTDSPAERQEAIDYYNQRLLTPGRDSIRSAKDKLLYRILGSSFDKESSSHESKYTAEYNHHSVLKGKQKTELPDFLQKEIIDAKTASFGKDLMDAFAERERESYLKNMGRNALVGTGIGAGVGAVARLLGNPGLAKTYALIGAGTGLASGALNTYSTNDHIDVARKGGVDRDLYEALYNKQHADNLFGVRSHLDAALKDVRSKKASWYRK